MQALEKCFSVTFSVLCIISFVPYIVATQNKHSRIPFPDKYMYLHFVSSVPKLVGLWCRAKEKA